MTKRWARGREAPIEEHEHRPGGIGEDQPYGTLVTGQGSVNVTPNVADCYTLAGPAHRRHCKSSDSGRAEKPRRSAVGESKRKVQARGHEPPYCKGTLNLPGRL